MTEYCIERFKELETVTFDHFKTLQYPAISSQEYIIIPVIRSLKEQIDFDEDDFTRNYFELDKIYRINEKEIFMETTLDELVLSALNRSGYQYSGLREIVTTAVNVGLNTKPLSWYPDAKETLTFIKEAGYKLGLISNTHWRWSKEKRNEIQHYFDVLTLSYEHGYMKPHPSIFLDTLSKLGTSPKKCLHVGDDVFTDINGAKSVGMKTAFINRAGINAEADIQITQLSELSRYLYL